MRKIYISKSSGKESNSGLKPDEAWETFKNLENFAFKPGDHVLLKKGDEWYGQPRIASPLIGESENPIVFSSYGTNPAKPVIYGKIIDPEFIPVPEHQGLFCYELPYKMIIRNCISKTGNGKQQYAIVPRGSLNLNDPDQLSEYLAKFEPGTWGPGGTFDKVFIRPENPNKIPSISFLMDGFVLNGENVIIRGFEFRECSIGIHICPLSKNIHIIDSKISDAIWIGIYLRGNSGLNQPVSDCLIENNVLESLGNDAFYILNGQSNIIRKNRVTGIYKNIMGLDIGGDKCAIGLQQSKDTLIEENIISNVVGTGVDYYFDEGSIVKNNWFFDMKAGAISPHGTNMVVENNAFFINHVPEDPSWGRGISATNTGNGDLIVRGNYFNGVNVYGMNYNVNEGSKGRFISEENILIATPDRDFYFAIFAGDKFHTSRNIFVLASTKDIKTYFKCNGKRYEDFDLFCKETKLEHKSLFLKPGSESTKFLINSLKIKP